MGKIQLFSKIEGGHISDGCRKAITNALKSLEGRFAMITIEERKRNRSLSQNAYMWGVVIPPIVTAFNEYGNNVDSEQVHEFLKDEVGKLTKMVVLPDGEVKRISGSTAELKTMEFEDYLERVRAWAAEVLGIQIPMPNERFNKGAKP